MAVCCKLLQIAVLCIVKVTWKFSKQKQAHVGMESNQIRYDITFMPTLLLVLFLSTTHTTNLDLYMHIIHTQ